MVSAKTTRSAHFKALSWQKLRLVSAKAPAAWGSSWTSGTPTGSTSGASVGSSCHTLHGETFASAGEKRFQRLPGSIEALSATLFREAPKLWIIYVFAVLSHLMAHLNTGQTHRLAGGRPCSSTICVEGCLASATKTFQ